jgi:hypothetical protein
MGIAHIFTILKGTSKSRGGGMTSANSRSEGRRRYVHSATRYVPRFTVNFLKENTS